MRVSYRRLEPSWQPEGLDHNDHARARDMGGVGEAGAYARGARVEAATRESALC